MSDAVFRNEKCRLRNRLKPLHFQVLKIDELTAMSCQRETDFVFTLTLCELIH